MLLPINSDDLNLLLEDYYHIKELQKGNENALKPLYEKHSTNIFNVILGFVKVTEDAEEILQDVFVIVFDKSADFQFYSAVNTWMYRIAVNKSLDFLRKKKAQKRFGFFTAIYKKDEIEPRAELLEPMHPGIQQEQKEEMILLYSLIDQLTEKQKVAFVLTQLDGRAQNEVAEIMEISRKAVESLVKRAKENLKKSLIHYYPEREIIKKKRLTKYE